MTALIAQEIIVVRLGLGESIDGRAHLTENLVETLDPDALDVAQALGDVEDEESTVSLAAAKFFWARSCWVRAMMPAVTAPIASSRRSAAAETASESARRCWRTSCDRRSSLGMP